MNSTDQYQKIIIFGGAGYLGSVLTEVLLSKGYKVCVFDNFQYGKHSLSKISNHPCLEIITGDIQNIREVTLAIQGCDAAILLAAISSAPACKDDPQRAININYLANINVAYACKYFGIKRFIFASTHSVYGIKNTLITEETVPTPISLYGELKLKVEKIILGLADVEFTPTILRMGTLFGLSPRMRFDLVVNSFVKDAITKGVMTVNGGEQWRPLLHVRDAAHAYLKLLESPKELIDSEIFNIGSDDQNVKICDLANIVAEEILATKIHTIPEKGPDLRDYRVCHKKVNKILGYQTEFPILFGINEIISAFQEKKFSQDFDIKYYNHTNK
jgi:nucleoside-diphosphate-sugar epimerase